MQFPNISPSRFPHRLQVLAVWLLITLLTLLIFNLSAIDTPASRWVPAHPTYLEHVSLWDSKWYHRIITERYFTKLTYDANGHVRQNTWAFMPVFPLLSEALATLTSTITAKSYFACAVVVSWISSAAVALGLDAWLCPRVGKRASLLGVALFFSFAPAIIMQLPYAESLTLALLTFGFILLTKRRFIWAVMLFGIAELTRPIGVPLGATIGLWWFWEELRARGIVSPTSRFDSSFLPFKKPANTAGNVSDDVVATAPQAATTPLDINPTPLDISPTPLSKKDRIWLFVIAIITCAGALFWPAFAWFITGVPTAYTDTETAWREDNLAPFMSWIKQANIYGGPNSGIVALIAVLVLSICALSSSQLRKLGRLAWMWCVCYWVYLLVFFDPSSSILRMLLMMAPLAWVLGAKLSNHLRTAVAFIALSVVSQVLWIAWIWDAYSLSLSKIYWTP